MNNIEIMSIYKLKQTLLKYVLSVCGEGERDQVWKYLVSEAELDLVIYCLVASNRYKSIYRKLECLVRVTVRGESLIISECV